MKKFKLFFVLLMTILFSTTTVLAEDSPACDGLFKALEKIPPENPSYKIIFEKAQTICREAVDRAALIALYKGTNGEEWSVNTNWLDETIHHCLWYGVTCDNNNLTGLFLSGNRLSGSIPPEIGNLKKLLNLYLYNNQLSGTIPPELGNLTSLRYLYLNSNQLTGSIPPELEKLANITDIRMQYNQLSGSIPPELGNLTNLNYLYLHYNQLAGPIPPEMGNLDNLNILYLFHNQLSDCIPWELSNLKMLWFLRLESNNFSGWETQAALDWANSLIRYSGPRIVSTSCP